MLSICLIGSLDKKQEQFFSKVLLHFAGPFEKLGGIRLGVNSAVCSSGVE